MKKYLVLVAALLVCGAALAAQDTALTQAEVRDPRRLETWLEGNAADAQSRLAACEAGAITLASGKIIVGNAGGTGAAVKVSGDIDLSNTGAMTIKDVSVEDNDIALASSYMLVGNAGGTGTAISVHGDASMDNAGALSVTQLNSIAVATVTDGAALGATALQPDTITIVVATNGVSGCSIAVSNSLATAVHMVGWWSLTPGGTADATEFISFLDDGAGSLLSATNATTVVFVSDNTGLAQLTNLVSAAGSTNYFNVVQRDGSVTSSALIEIAGP